MKLAIFDFDGVIVESLEVAYYALGKVFDPVPSLDEYKSWFEGNVYKAEEIKDNATRQNPEDDPFFSFYEPELMKREPVVGLNAFLSEYAKKQPLSIVSSSINRPINAFLDKHSIRSYFERVYGADVHKSKVVKLEMLLKEYDCAPTDCLFITDTLGDMRESAKVGVPVVGVTWGFHERKRLEQGNPEKIFDTPEELYQYLRQR